MSSYAIERYKQAVRDYYSAIDLAAWPIAMSGAPLALRSFQGQGTAIMFGAEMVNFIPCPKFERVAK